MRVLATSWRLSAFEFAVAWEHMGRDRLPFPLTYRGDAETADEFDAQRRIAAESVRQQFDDNLHRALAVLAEPLVRVSVCGFEGPVGDRMVRIHGGVDRVVGALAVQLPGPELEVGADVLLSLHRREAFESQVVGAMPSTAPGRGRGLRVDKSDLNSGGAVSVLRSPNYVSPREEASRFFNRPHAGFGEITVGEGQKRHGRNAPDGQILQWIDYVDDGRYLVRNTATITAVPGTRDTMTAELRRTVGYVLADAEGV